MAAIRRWYAYLVCAISLWLLAWSAIGLLQGLLRSPSLGLGASERALQVAIVVVCLPFYLVHWLWAQRLAVRDEEERSATVRRFFLYGMMASFLLPMVKVAIDGLRMLLELILGRPDAPMGQPVYLRADLTDGLCILLVLGVLWLYHQRVATADEQAASETEGAALIHVLYLLFFAGAGVFLMAVGSVSILQWLARVSGLSGTTVGSSPLAGPSAQLVVGVVVWVAFWRAVQHRFATGADERSTVLRIGYLHVVVFAAVVGVLVAATLVLSAVFDWMLGLRWGDLADPLSVLLVLAIIWAYHSLIWQRDAAQAGEAPRQAGVRRLYVYLVACLGLYLLLIGVAGDIHVVIEWGGQALAQVARYSAALLVALPVWALAWRGAERAALASGTAGAAERGSMARRFYLYLFIFAATITALICGVGLVYHGVSFLLGEPLPARLASEVLHETAYGLMALVIWLYSAWVVQRDGRLDRAEMALRAAPRRVAVVDGHDGRMGRILLDALRRGVQGVVLVPVGLTEQAVLAMEGQAGIAPAAAFTEAEVIVTPWQYAAGGSEVAATLASSPARKVLLPAPAPGWEWAGEPPANEAGLVRETVRTVRQILEAETAGWQPRLGGRDLVLLVIAAIVVLLPLLIGMLVIISDVQ